MTTRQLSPEIISLIHHVELNESGWWKKAIGQVGKGLLWTAATPLISTELQEDALNKEVGVRLPEESLVDCSIR